MNTSIKCACVILTMLFGGAVAANAAPVDKNAPGTGRTAQGAGSKSANGTGFQGKYRDRMLKGEQRKADGKPSTAGNPAVRRRYLGTTRSEYQAQQPQ